MQCCAWAHELIRTESVPFFRTREHVPSSRTPDTTLHGKGDAMLATPILQSVPFFARDGPPCDLTHRETYSKGVLNCLCHNSTPVNKNTCYLRATAQAQMPKSKKNETRMQRFKRCFLPGAAQIPTHESKQLHCKRNDLSCGCNAATKCPACCFRNAPQTGLLVRNVEKLCVL